MTLITNFEKLQLNSELHYTLNGSADRRRVVFQFGFRVLLTDLARYELPQNSPQGIFRKAYVFKTLHNLYSTSNINDVIRVMKTTYKMLVVEPQ
jgi:hypothetical protein